MKYKSGEEPAVGDAVRGIVCDPSSNQDSVEVAGTVIAIMPPLWPDAETARSVTVLYAAIHPLPVEFKEPPRWLYGDPKHRIVFDPGDEHTGRSALHAVVMSSGYARCGDLVKI